MTRGRLLRAAAGTSAAVALGATGLARAAAGPLADLDLDLALARLAVAVEHLSIAFLSTAIQSKHFGDSELRALQRARFNEDEHLGAVSQILSGAGQTPETADDFDFTFPAKAFDTRQSIAELGATLETIAVGAYLGAVDAFGPSDLRTTAARIAVSEAQHLSFFSRIAYRRPIGISFPAPLDYAAASAALDPYLG
jgi:ferritin-like protein